MSFPSSSTSAILPPRLGRLTSTVWCGTQGHHDMVFLQLQHLSILSAIQVSLMEGRPDLVQTLQGAFMEAWLAQLWLFFQDAILPWGEPGSWCWTGSDVDLVGSFQVFISIRETNIFLIVPTRKWCCIEYPCWSIWKMRQVQQMTVMVTMSIHIAALELVLIFWHTTCDRSNIQIDR